MKRRGPILVCLISVGAINPAFAQAPAAEAISDSAFEQALPPLTTDAAVPPAPEADEATAIDDDLSAPLSPLSSVADAPPLSTGPVDDEARPVLRYSVEATGFGTTALESEFRELSALYKGQSAAAPASQVRLRAEADVELLERLMQSQGYYDARASVDFDPPSGRTDRLKVSLTVAPGERYALGAVRVTGAPPRPERIALDALTLKTGDPIEAAVVQAAEANVALKLPQQGYPFATVGLRDIVLDPATSRGDYSLPVDPGPASTFGAIRVTGTKVFEPEHVALLARFKPGQPYDSRQVEDLRQALVATSLLSVVALKPVRTGAVDADGTERADIEVSQSPAPARSLSAAAGYGAGEGFRLSGAWTHRNLFPPEGALSLNAVAGTQEQRLGVTLRRSNAGQRDRTRQAAAEVSRETRDAYNARSVNLSARVSRDSTPLWQKRWTYAYGAELIATNETRFSEAMSRRARDTFLIAALPTQLGFDTSDSLLDPTRGLRITGRLSPEVSRRGDTSTYVRSLLETAAYAPVGSSLVFAGRFRLGAIAGIARDDLAPSRRLYAGGGGSVRGFGYQGLGPRDAMGNPRGGRALTELSVEARYRFGNFGIAPFVDAGQVYDASTPKFDNLRFGVGIGGRYYTAFGPVRVDIATPIARRAGEPRVAVYISIGQAF